MNGKTLDLGLLVLRLCFGAFFIYHGKDKVFAGPAKWEELGGAMKVFHIDFYPVAWGAAAAFSEFLGGILVVLGLFFRPACAALVCTMIVAMGLHLNMGHPMKEWLPAAMCLVVFVALLLTGSGRIAVRKR